MKKINKKSMTEIFGLVFIVMMLMIVIVIVTVALKTNEDNRTLYISKTVAQNYLTSFLQIETSCDYFTFSELIEDCVTYGTSSRKECYDGSTNNFIDSCEFVEKYVDLTLKDTLYKWGYNYQFSVTDNNINKIKIPTTTPKGDRDRGFYFSNQYKVYLDIYS